MATIRRSRCLGTVLAAVGLSCALIPRLSAAQPLSIDRLRAVTSKYGPVREGNQMRPFEELVLLYDINGAKMDAEGKVSIGLKMVWTAADGHEVAAFTNDLNVVNVFGGPVMGLGSLCFPDDVAQGVYTLNLTVEDKLAAATAHAQYSVELVKPKFDIVNVRFALGSADGPERPNRFFVYDPMFILLEAVDFSIKDGRVALGMDVRVEETDGKVLHSFKDMARMDDKFPDGGKRRATFSVMLNLTRPGQFVAVITMTDGANGQPVTRKVPFVVEAAN